VYPRIMIIELLSEYGVAVATALIIIRVIYFLWKRKTDTALPAAGGVVITGASSGIGETTAIYLDAKGYTVFAGVRTETDYKRLKDMLSPRSTPIMLDVTQPAQIAAAVNIVLQTLLKANIGLVGLINNAGISIIGPLECLAESDLRYNFEVNLFGLINTTNAFTPLLRAGRKFPGNPNYPQNKSTIVHIGSTMGKVAFPFFGVYSMTKFALEAMVDAQRSELAQTSDNNIRVCLMELGNVQTPMFEKNNVRLKQHLNKMFPYYKPFLTALPKAVDSITAGAILPVKVAQDVEKALRSSNPQSRYRVGWEARYIPLLFSFIPDKLRDWIIFKLFVSITKMKVE